MVDGPPVLHVDLSKPGLRGDAIKSLQSLSAEGRQVLDKMNNLDGPINKNTTLEDETVERLATKYCHAGLYLQIEQLRRSATESEDLLLGPLRMLEKFQSLTGAPGLSYHEVLKMREQLRKSAFAAFSAQRYADAVIHATECYQLTKNYLQSVNGTGLHQDMVFDLLIISRACALLKDTVKGLRYKEELDYLVQNTTRYIFNEVVKSNNKDPERIREAWLNLGKYSSSIIGPIIKTEPAVFLGIIREAAELSSMYEQFEQANEYYRKLVAFHEYLYGPAHPLTADSCAECSYHFFSQRDFRKAAKQAEKCLRIRIQVFGDVDAASPSSLVSDAYSNVGIIYRILGYPQDALSALLSALDIRMRLSDGDRSCYECLLILLSIGILCHQYGQYRRALEIYKEVFEGVRRFKGFHSPEVAKVMQLMDTLSNDISAATNNGPVSAGSTLEGTLGMAVIDPVCDSRTGLKPILWNESLTPSLDVYRSMMEFHSGTAPKTFGFASVPGVSRNKALFADDLRGLEIPSTALLPFVRQSFVSPEILQFLNYLKSFGFLSTDGNWLYGRRRVPIINIPKVIGGHPVFSASDSSKVVMEVNGNCKPYCIEFCLPIPTVDELGNVSVESLEDNDPKVFLPILDHDYAVVLTGFNGLPMMVELPLDFLTHDELDNKNREELRNAVIKSKEPPTDPTLDLDHSDQNEQQQLSVKKHPSDDTGLPVSFDTEKKIAQGKLLPASAPKVGQSSHNESEQSHSPESAKRSVSKLTASTPPSMPETGKQGGNISKSIQTGDTAQQKDASGKTLATSPAFKVTATPPSPVSVEIEGRTKLESAGKVLPKTAMTSAASHQPDAKVNTKLQMKPTMLMKKTGGKPSSGLKIGKAEARGASAPKVKTQTNKQVTGVGLPSAKTSAKAAKVALSSKTAGTQNSAAAERMKGSIGPLVAKPKVGSKPFATPMTLSKKPTTQTRVPGDPGQAKREWKETDPLTSRPAPPKKLSDATKAGGKVAAKQKLLPAGKHNAENPYFDEVLLDEAAYHYSSVPETQKRVMPKTSRVGLKLSAAMPHSSMKKMSKKPGATSGLAKPPGLNIPRPTKLLTKAKPVHPPQTTSHLNLEGSKTPIPGTETNTPNEVTASQTPKSHPIQETNVNRSTSGPKGVADAGSMKPPVPSGAGHVVVNGDENLSQKNYSASNSTSTAPIKGTVTKPNALNPKNRPSSPLEPDAVTRLGSTDSPGSTFSTGNPRWNGNGKRQPYREGLNDSSTKKPEDENVAEANRNTLLSKLADRSRTYGSPPEDHNVRKFEPDRSLEEAIVVSELNEDIMPIKRQKDMSLCKNRYKCTNTTAAMVVGIRSAFESSPKGPIPAINLIGKDNTVLETIPFFLDFETYFSRVAVVTAKMQGRVKGGDDQIAPLNKIVKALAPISATVTGAGDGLAMLGAPFGLSGTVFGSIPTSGPTGIGGYGAVGSYVPAEYKVPVGMPGSLKTSFGGGGGGQGASGTTTVAGTGKQIRIDQSIMSLNKLRQVATEGDEGLMPSFGADDNFGFGGGSGGGFGSAMGGFAMPSNTGMRGANNAVGGLQGTGDGLSQQEAGIKEALAQNAGGTYVKAPDVYRDIEYEDYESDDSAEDEVRKILKNGGFELLASGALPTQLNEWTSPEEFKNVLTSVLNTKSDPSTAARYGFGEGSDGEGEGQGPGAGAGGAGAVNPLEVKQRAEEAKAKAEAAKAAPKPPGPPKKPGPPKPGASGKKGPPPKKKDTGVGAKLSKYKKLIWDPIEDPKGTIFSSEFSDYLSELNLGDLEAAFGRKVDKPDAAAAEAKVKPTVINLLPDAKRAHNMNIALSRFNRYSLAELRNAIIDMDTEKLKVDDAEILANIAPLAEEDAAVSEYMKNGGDMTKVDRPEKFVAAMLGVPMFKHRMNALIFISTFATDIDSIQIPLERFKKACSDITSSTRIKKLLAAILKIGNVLNSTESVGFKTNILTKLEQFKTTSKPLKTFIEYLVDLFWDTDPDVLNVRQDFKALEDLGHVDVAALEAELVKIATGYKTVQNHMAAAQAANSSGGDIDPLERTIQNFIAQTGGMLEETNSLLADAKKLFLDTANLFGENEASLAKIKPESFLKEFLGFIRAIEQRRKQKAEKVEREARTQARAKTGGPAPSKAPPAPPKAPPAAKVRPSAAPG